MIYIQIRDPPQKLSESLVYPCIHKLWLITFEETKPRRRPHPSHFQGKYNHTLFQNQQVNLNHILSKMPYVLKTYKSHSDLHKHFKLSRKNDLILTYIEKSNRRLNYGKDKDHNKNHQNGFPRDIHTSKPNTHLTYSKNYKNSRILLKIHNTKQK